MDAVPGTPCPAPHLGRCLPVAGRLILRDELGFTRKAIRLARDLLEQDPRRSIAVHAMSEVAAVVSDPVFEVMGLPNVDGLVLAVDNDVDPGC